MNRISLYAFIFGLLLMSAIWFFFVRNNSSSQVVINENGRIVLDQKINPQAGENQNISKDNNITTAKNEQEKIMKATLHTNQGDITIEFDLVNTPNTAENFIKLAKAGFYDGTKFHRVIKGFMNQGGDPFSKDDSQMARWGTGGSGYSFDDEIGPNNSNVAGTISMANAGPNTNGSQFFINVADNNGLDSKHTVFGKVTIGADVVMAINSTQTDAADRPVSPIIIENITLE